MTTTNDGPPLQLPPTPEEWEGAKELIRNLATERHNMLDHSSSTFRTCHKVLCKRAAELTQEGKA